MMTNSFIKTITAITVVAVHITGTISTSIFTISDDRVRGMDITPALGRGYSLMTNQFYSTCLVVEEATVPSYNYDCKFKTFHISTLFVSNVLNKKERVVFNVMTCFVSEYRLFLILLFH